MSQTNIYDLLYMIISIKKNKSIDNESGMHLVIGQFPVKRNAIKVEITDLAEVRSRSYYEI